VFVDTIPMAKDIVLPNIAKVYYLKINKPFLDSTSWDLYYNARKETFNNNCHTLNRLDCYLSTNDTNRKLYPYELNTTLASRYYNAEPCARDVLSSGFMSFSLIGLLFLIFTLI
jgi:hypothetical protein